MNFYNPYFYQMPQNIATNTAKIGFFSKILGGRTFSLGGFLSGTERVLNFANQAIPLVRQVKPIIGNAKTMFKVMNEFKRNENTLNKQNNTTNNNTMLERKSNDTTEILNNNEPKFFM